MVAATSKITAKADSDFVTIYFDGILHIHFLRKHFRGLSSFREIVYSIEILLQDATLRLEYDKREHWVGVLAAIDSIL